MSAHIDEETSRRMRRYLQVDWSQVILKAIDDRLRLEESLRNLNLTRLAEAKRLANSIWHPSPGWDSTKEIRNWQTLRR